MNREFEVLTVRLGPDASAAINALAEQRKVSRAEAARLALTYGVPLARQGLNINIERVLVILEFIGAGIDVIMSREHADVSQHLEALASQRVDQFHA